MDAVNSTRPREDTWCTLWCKKPMLQPLNCWSIQLARPMKINFLIISRLSFLLFILGVLIGLSLSAGILWGELEVRVDSPYPPSRIMRMNCPLLLSRTESGTVEAVIVNSTTDEIWPTVKQDLNRTDSPNTTQIVPLAPTATQTLAWTVDGSNLLFNRLILVNIFQEQYRDNPSRLGSCGILILSLFGLSGTQTFDLLFASSLIGILLGGGLWVYARQQLNDWSNLTQAAFFLGALTIAALLSSIIRWWGLTLVFDFLTLLLGGTLLTEFTMSPGGLRSKE